MAIKIVVDSASDFTVEEANKLGLTFLPLTIKFGDEEYQDGITITKKMFYDKLEEVDYLPKTVPITDNVFKDIFDRLTENGDKVIAITMSSKISGTNSSAIVASVENDNVYVIDSLVSSIGERILVLYALELIEKGLDAKEIADMLNEKKKKIKMFFLLDTLEYLHKGGKISDFSTFTGDILSVKPVMTMENGLVSILKKARGKKKACALLTESILDTGGVDKSMPYALAYSGNDSSLLNMYIDGYADRFHVDVKSADISVIGSTIGTHIGPGAIGVAFFSE